MHLLTLRQEILPVLLSVCKLHTVCLNRHAISRYFLSLFRSSPKSRKSVSVQINLYLITSLSLISRRLKLKQREKDKDLFSLWRANRISRFGALFLSRLSCFFTLLEPQSHLLLTCRTTAFFSISFSRWAKAAKAPERMEQKKRNWILLFFCVRLLKLDLLTVRLSLKIQFLFLPQKDTHAKRMQRDKVKLHKGVRTSSSLTWLNQPTRRHCSCLAGLFVRRT